MKRAASTTDMHVLNQRPDALFSQSPPRCEFHDEDGYAQREFRRLSRTEQQAVLKDIYGIEEPIEETSSFIRESLEELDTTLQELISKKKTLEIVRDRYPAFFENETFRLQFLRVDSFNIKLASKRILRHFEKKHELFGPEKLGNKITLEDLSDDDMDFMRTGGIQVVPAQDRGGRHVVFSRHRNWRYQDISNALRCLWYLSMLLVEESGPSMCETVGIGYNLGNFSPEMFDRTALKSSFDILKGIPCRLVGYHYCFDDVRFRMVWGVITVFLGKKARMRARDHEGSHVECRYGLMSYGIPVDSLPLTIEGFEDNSRFYKWLDERQCKENKGSD